MPRRSQASSFAGATGLWAVRSALKPAACSTSISRSSERPSMIVPSGPWLECVHAPRTLTGLPLRRKPLPSHSSDRIPNVTSRNPLRGRQRATRPLPGRGLGESGDHSAGAGPTGPRYRCWSLRASATAPAPGRRRRSVASSSSTLTRTAVAPGAVPRLVASTSTWATECRSSTTGVRDEDAPQRDPHRGGGSQPRVLVDARARVPAAGLTAVVHTHSDHIDAAGLRFGVRSKPNDVYPYGWKPR